MKLVIDLGNTFQKYAVFSGDEIVYYEAPDLVTMKSLLSVFNLFTINSAILSSVIHHDKEIESIVRSRCDCVILDDKTPLPFKNTYKTPETLGKDRLAAAVAGSNMFPGKNVLVIDAGTCIKYDFINAQAEYLGGSISPGLQMRFDALHTFTEKLPLIELADFKPLIGINTTESLLSGVINGTLAEIDGIIDRYREKYPEIQVVLSGGDAEYLAGKLKNEIFAVSNIVLTGLKIILDHNDKQKPL
jgi:type III pantothenate kinase